MMECHEALAEGTCLSRMDDSGVSMPGDVVRSTCSVMVCVHEYGAHQHEGPPPVAHACIKH